MKKSLAIFMSMLVLLAVSCGNNDDDVVLSPYAVLKSFSIKNIKSKYPAYTSEGLDTTETKTILGASYPFSINQVTGEVGNLDSLPFATRVDKVVISMDLMGYAKIYDDATGVFEGFTTSDSIDFTTPRKFRITSADSEYFRDYTVSLNVHQVEPEKMVWDKYQSVDFLELCRALEFNGELCLFGKKNGEWMLAKSSLTGIPSWETEPIVGLSADADMSTIQAFGGALYLVAADGVYTSADALVWSLCHSCSGALAIVGASDEDGKMWVATDNGLLSTADGVVFENAGELPSEFPVYGVSIMSYTLSHHSGIVRYMLVGYDNEAMDGVPTIWSRLSTEDKWAKYENENNPFPCPALKGLTVVRYDDFLYAFGGAGSVRGEDVGAFSSFFISRDNGITWKTPDGFYQRMPAGLQGCEEPFVATVDPNNVMWIVCGGDTPVVWKGLINRLGFKN